MHFAPNYNAHFCTEKKAFEIKTDQKDEQECSEFKHCSQKFGQKIEKNSLKWTRIFIKHGFKFGEKKVFVKTCQESCYS